MPSDGEGQRVSSIETEPRRNWQGSVCGDTNDDRDVQAAAHRPPHGHGFVSMQLQASYFEHIARNATAPPITFVDGTPSNRSRHRASGTKRKSGALVKDMSDAYIIELQRHAQW